MAPSLACRFRKYVENSFAPADKVLQLLGVPTEPQELVDHFKIFFADNNMNNVGNFQKILDLKVSAATTTTVNHAHFFIYLCTYLFILYFLRTLNRA